MAEKLPISVIICVKNGEATIGKCLESALTNNPAEIIVIDGNSSDRTVEIAKKYTDKVFSDEGKGLGYARQLGVELATQDLIAFVDSDVILPDSQVFSIMMRELKESYFDAIHSQLYSPETNYWYRSINFAVSLVFNKPGLRKKPLGTICVLIRRGLLKKYQFDPFFKGAAEDTDLYLRLLRDGHNLGISSNYIEHYPAVSDFKSFLNHKYRYGKGGARLFWKYKSLKLLFYSFFVPPAFIALCVVHKKLQYIPFFILDWLSWTFGFISQMIGLLRQGFKEKK